MKHRAHVLNSLGWKWDAEGALLTIEIDGRRFMVHVPLKVLHIEFGRAVAQQPGGVGCALDGSSVGGFFSSLRRAARRLVPKSIQRAVTSASRAVKRVASKVIQPVLRGAQKVLNNSVVKLIASNIPLVSTGYNWARTGLAAANTGLSLLTNPNLRTLGRGIASAVSGPMDLEYESEGVGLVPQLVVEQPGQVYAPTPDQVVSVGYPRCGHHGHGSFIAADGRRMMAYRPMWRPGAVPAGW